MTGYNGTATCTYRADGMRVSKVSSGTTTRYRYDGQMGMQDVEVTGTNTVVTNYGLGARGIDFIERVGTSTVTGFPIYDSHGNNVVTLTKSGTSYFIGDQRSYSVGSQVLGSVGSSLNWAKVWSETWQVFVFGAILGAAGALGKALQVGVKAGSASIVIGEFLEGFAKGTYIEWTSGLSTSEVSGIVWYCAARDAQIVGLLGSMELD